MEKVNLHNLLEKFANSAIDKEGNAIKYAFEIEGLFKKLQEENQRYKEFYQESLEEIKDCIESFYDEGNPRRLFPELKKFASYINVMDKVVNEVLEDE